MTTYALNHPAIVAPTRHATPFRPLDVVVTGMGLAIACCGYFAIEVSWMLAQIQ